MKAIVIRRHGGPAVLKLKELPSPEPGTSELCVRVRAARINFADLFSRLGLRIIVREVVCFVAFELGDQLLEAFGKTLRRCRQSPAPSSKLEYKLKFSWKAKAIQAASERSGGVAWNGAPLDRPVIPSLGPSRVRGTRAAAHRYLHERKNIGKVLLIP